jgi:iron complex transport system ATP-binding protein
VRELFSDHIDIAYEDNLVVEDLSLSIKPEKITVLVGANGSGKSTILKALCRLLKPKKGAVYLDGKAIHRQSTREVARHLAILPQSPQAPGRLTVAELVAYGRFPHKRGFGALTRHDREIIAGAIARTGLGEFSGRAIDSLSGGQRQRVWIAMALAQETELLFLDEPTTYLDMAHQFEVLELLERLNREQKRTIVMVLHDLNHASRYAQRMIAIKQGRVLYEGSPEEVMNEAMLSQVFGIKANFLVDPASQRMVCVPCGLETKPG